MSHNPTPPSGQPSSGSSSSGPSSGPSSGSGQSGGSFSTGLAPSSISSFSAAPSSGGGQSNGSHSYGSTESPQSGGSDQSHVTGASNKIVQPSGAASHSTGQSAESGGHDSTASTAPVNEDAVDGHIEQKAEKPKGKPWGSLMPMNNKSFKYFAMEEDSNIFGRGDNCHFVFDAKSFKNNIGLYTSLSKQHFRIFREHHQSRDTSSYTVYLQDLSSNGTFINGQRIGKNKKKVLENHDEISLATKSNKAFMFLDAGDSKLEQEKYPSDLKQKYTVLKVIGSGACGEVRLAIDKETDKKFAVKIISKRKFSVSPTLQKSMISEVNILRQLKHPGIIEIGDVYESDDALYIFLELIIGGELYDRVTELGKFEERIAKLLFYQMLLAVDYLHSNGITHRDLKPENVLLVSNNLETGVKITDFGLSRFVGENSLMRTLCGTPNYLAPEVLRNAGMGGYSKLVDCWSLGCILYICLSGYPPFSSNVEGMTVIDQVSAGYYNFPKKIWGNVSSEAIDLIKKLMNIDETKRLSVAEALKHPWLQEEEMKSKADKLMRGIPIPSDMHPPPIIPARKSSAEDSTGSPESKKRKISSEDTGDISSAAESTGF